MAIGVSKVEFMGYGEPQAARGVRFTINSDGVTTNVSLDWTEASALATGIIGKYAEFRNASEATLKAAMGAFNDMRVNLDSQPDES